MTRSQRIGTLMFRYVRNELGRNGKKELNAWRNESPENDQMFQRKTDTENILRDLGIYFEARERCDQKLKENFPEIWAKPVVKMRSRIYRISKIAAIFLVVLCVGLYLLLPKNQNSGGSYQAVLVNADGVHTALDDFHRGYLAGSAGIKIEKRENGELVYIAKNYPNAGKDKYFDLYTAKGGTFSMKLPDGSMIWLNALSSIKYPANFSLDSIKIMLEGEAYFELAKDSKHHFLITPAFARASGDKAVNGLRLSVNGFKITSTSGHFNIRSLEDDPIVSATMVEGTALVRLDSVHSELQILPGQQAQLLDGKLNLIATADTSEIIAWKNGVFYYKDATLQIIMPAIAKWYDVEIQYGSQIPYKKISLRMPRSTPISEVLDNLRKQGLHITQRGKIITIWK
jgi:transmembrane sensor